MLCTLLAYAAVAVFLKYRRPAIGFGPVAAVLGLSLLALWSKQQAVAIPAVLILIDLLWNEGSAFESVKRNIRLHGLLVAGAIAGAVWVFSRLRFDTTAGLRVPGITPVEYFLTQVRALALCAAPDSAGRPEPRSGLCHLAKPFRSRSGVRLMGIAASDCGGDLASALLAAGVGGHLHFPRPPGADVELHSDHRSRGGAARLFRA